MKTKKQATKTIVTQNQASIKEFNKSFGAFVKVYNTAAGTTFNVKTALQNTEIVKLYSNVTKVVKEASKNIVGSPSTTTKMKSYTMVDIPAVDAEVLDAVGKNPMSSRAELAKITGRRLSTVCGAINRLIYNQMVFVAGTGQDEESNRSVELVAQR